MRVYVALGVIVVSLLAISSFSLAAQPPPDEIHVILEELEELEESFEKQQWDEALAITHKIDNDLLGILVKTQLDAPLLEQSLAGLKAALHEMNSKKTEVQYLVFQKRYIGFLDNFSYELHPVFLLIKTYINDSAKEAAAQRDFDEVASEMAEIGNLIKNTKAHFKDKGITEQELAEFNAGVVATIKAARKKDAGRVNRELQHVSNMYDSFFARTR